MVWTWVSMATTTMMMPIAVIYFLKFLSLGGWCLLVDSIFDDISFIDEDKKAFLPRSNNNKHDNAFAFVIVLLRVVTAADISYSGSDGEYAAAMNMPIWQGMKLVYPSFKITIR
mmetsp:Transcript_24614/g.29707  ORF Transcript_24614/g.29707 Transcript_24614/m.29707 type:complete len:114 (-) Transcript_24614:1-342(-)